MRLEFCRRSLPGIRTAFQAIARTRDGSVIGHEALARNLRGRVPLILLKDNASVELARFDAHCRERAVFVAHLLGASKMLFLNVVPCAIDHREYGIRRTVEFAIDLGLAAQQLVFELTEHQPLGDWKSARKYIDKCRSDGIAIAIDDFGDGNNNKWELIEALQPEIVKLSKSAISNLTADTSKSHRAMIDKLLKNEVALIAEGVDEAEKLSIVRSVGIEWAQGYYYSMPVIDQLPTSYLDKNLKSDAL
jgi:EAL domain-containing protein (putative c-di-GMP-specific phosphodiesterase class I)